jgi:hypothetical protein
MDQDKDAVFAEIIDTALQRHSVVAETKGQPPIFVERPAANVLLVRQRDKTGLTHIFRVEVTAAYTDAAARYLMEAQAAA